MPVVMGNGGVGGLGVQTGGNGAAPQGTGVPGVAGFVPSFVDQRKKEIAEKRAEMAKNPSAFAGWRKDESGKTYWYDPQAGPTGVVEGVGEGPVGRADAFAVRKQAQNAFDQRGALTRKIPPHEAPAPAAAEPVSTYGTSSVTLTGSTAPAAAPYAPITPGSLPAMTPAPAPVLPAAPTPTMGGGAVPYAPLQYGHQAPVAMPFVPIGQTMPSGSAPGAGPSAAQAAGAYGAQAYGASTGKGFAPANAPNSAQAAQQGAAYGQRTDRNAQRLGIQSYNQSSPTAYQRPGIYASLNPSTNQKVIY